MLIAKRQKTAYLFILPFFIVYLIFSLYPILSSFFLSFFADSDPLSGKGMIFAGLDNYVRLFTSNYFFGYVGNTIVIWLFSIIPQLTIALILALILNERWVKGRTLLRSVYYFPNLVTPITVGLLFNMLFSYPGGAVNNLFAALKLLPEPVDFLRQPILVRMVIGIATCWQNFGYNIIFLTAGLHSISQDVYEAAEVDGASAFRKTVSITLPLLKPMLLYIMITSIIGGLQIFDVPKMFPEGMADYTRTMVLYMYESAFKRWQFGYGASIAYGIFMIIAVFSLIALRVTRGKGGDLE